MSTRVLTSWLVAIAICTSALDAGEIGQIVRLDGEAAILHGNQRDAATVGSKLFDDDRIVTADGSKLVIHLTCGTVIHTSGRSRMRLPMPTSDDFRYVTVWNGELRVVNDGKSRVAVQTPHGVYVQGRAISRVNCNGKRTIAASEVGYVETHHAESQKLLTPGDWVRCAAGIEYHGSKERFRPIWNVCPDINKVAKKTTRPPTQFTIVSTDREAVDLASHQRVVLSDDVHGHAAPSGKVRQRAPVLGLGSQFSSGPSPRIAR